MRYFTVCKQWSACDQDTVVVAAQSAEEIRQYYRALGERGPRYVEIIEVGDILTLNSGKMKSVEIK